MGFLLQSSFPLGPALAEAASAHPQWRVRSGWLYVLEIQLNQGTGPWNLSSDSDALTLSSTLLPVGDPCG